MTIYLIKFFDIFAGIGGFRSGLERAGGFECVGYCEVDKYAKQAYEALYDTSKEVYYDDARTIDPETMPDVDLICGGFPCQSFSIAGKRLLPRCGQKPFIVLRRVCFFWTLIDYFTFSAP